ncbi:MAG TPA: DinB family protein [Anaerolineae bacterium]|nr:DinB family protein [Anaerolineae bacterium]
MILNPPAPAWLYDSLRSWADWLEAELSPVVATVVWDESLERCGWSLRDLICYLRDVEGEVHQPRLQIMLVEADAFLAGVWSDNWVQERAYRLQDGNHALEALITARRQTAALLADMEAAMWQRRALHAYFGYTTLQELVYLMVQHDRQYQVDIETVIKKQGG